MLKFISGEEHETTLRPSLKEKPRDKERMPIIFTVGGCLGRGFLIEFKVHIPFPFPS